VPAVTVQQIGQALIGRYVLPLRLLRVLLNAALIGAVIVPCTRKREPSDSFAGYLLLPRLVFIAWRVRSRVVMQFCAYRN